MIRLDDLEAMAKAAIGRLELDYSTYKTRSPTVVIDHAELLALIRVARIAMEINDEYKHDLGHFSPMLEESLREIDL